MAEPVKVVLKRRSFVTFTIGKDQVEVLLDELSATEGATLEIRTARKVTGLRVLQELPGIVPSSSLATSPAAPKLANVKHVDESGVDLSKVPRAKAS